MNRLPTLFVGILFTFAFAWVGLVVLPYAQIGRLQPEVNADTGDIFPPTPSGLAEAGQKVYAANGCVYCHSQQVRPEDAGSDLARGWGSRRTVPRDYIRQSKVFLGTMRTGPDLSDAGFRFPDAKWHHLHMYNPRALNAYSIMPSFKFLYITRKIVGQKSEDALDLKGDDAPPAGYEVVPSEDAKALAAYLISLNRRYPLQEAPEK